MNRYLVFLKEHGVYAIGEERAYGCDVHYFLDGMEFSALACEPDEYVVIGYIEPI